MRVVSGSLGGRTFESPKGHRTHPMSDKVRGALFNILGDIANLEVLDLYSGSGAIGIEAVSRGATKVTMIELDPTAVEVCKRNIRALSIGHRSKIIRANVVGWSSNNPDILFDVVIIDPPYDRIQNSVLSKLASHSKPGGIVAYSLPPSITVELPSDYVPLAIKNYGDATLVFYRRTE